MRISSRADYQELPQGTEVNTKFEDVALGRATVEISAKQNQVQKGTMALVVRVFLSMTDCLRTECDISVLHVAYQQST